ncbi:glycosyltransferase [Clostridium beijerinckii]|uniref:Glycosyltransferase involved in cell wall biosynthesis n=2 Tax=Bacillati TaxID=1783272 RepID=A0AAE5H1I4_CLOBE|nr:glycosyltransferase [Clostridium beijerinckii]NSB12956.1 glycosyltransferase involved in cell wall biosynthesis [Clostridium beijerinckii]OOM28255.1 putative teichuronic acid biosynthesis glycosyltransferase TuaG [Clostridium beijerinckii]
MNNKKICFVTCVNNDRQYKECLLYINNLKIPEGYEIDYISIKEVGSITSGYNAAMNGTDAKYKVYLHQDTYIINENFIYDMLNIFNQDDEIGMIGVAGAKTIPTNAIWWESIHKYGKVYESHTGNMELLAFNNIEKNYEEVKAIDGLIMITQYDLPWREDIFEGWHFYDTSQSVEFNLAGYKVVVPKQDECWCIHDCGLVNTKNNYDFYRNIFLDEYSKNIYPLVSILIPAYNKADFLEIGLKSVLDQTYRNIEIIICDDSTSDEVEEMLEQYINKFKNIIYRRNKNDKNFISSINEGDSELKNLEGNSNAIKNFNKCLQLSKGEYVNFLMDDDIFFKDKISKMINYYIEYDDIKLVTSYRKIINKDGEILNDIKSTQRLTQNDSIIDGNNLVKILCEHMLNFIGEPTTVLFKKRDLKENLFGEFDEKIYYCNVDVAAWFNLILNGKVAYISEALSYMRIHDDMRSQKASVIILGNIEWYNIFMSLLKLNFYNKDDIKKLMNGWLIEIKYLLNLLTERKENIEYRELLYCIENAKQYLIN